MKAKGDSRHPWSTLPSMLNKSDWKLSSSRVIDLPLSLCLYHLIYSVEMPAFLRLYRSLLITILGNAALTSKNSMNMKLSLDGIRGGPTWSPAEK